MSREHDHDSHAHASRVNDGHAHPGHGHHHDAPDTMGRAFALGIALNTGFVAVEAFYGWMAGSLALLADAGHNLSDVAGLVLAWAALAAARLRPTERHTYGWRRGSIIAGFTNAVVLLVAMGSLMWEAFARLRAPAPVEGMTMIVVAAIGVVVNGATALLFSGGHRHDVNIRGAFMHMAADALVSLAVVLAGLIYLWRGWSWIDPAISLAIALVIVFGTWSLFRQSLSLLFDGVPAHIELAAVRAALLDVKGVLALHDLHVWALASMETALTAHVVLAPDAEAESVLHDATALLHQRFGIAHATLQLESPAYAAECLTESCSPV
ncbi:MAG TPA: cation diffusion facilitator family transporter [Pseudomonadales bacterium]